jgi:DNA polymerase-1
MRTLIVDGDMVAWVIASVASDNLESRAIAWVRKLARQLDGQRVICCFGDPSKRYFRHDLWPKYKEGRPEPIPGLDEVKAGLNEEWQCRELPTLESDDVMGILATYPKMEGQTVIVADDKDMKTIPGHHYSPRKKEVYLISPDLACRYHFFQTLMGDGTDHYPGCPGIGKKKAAEALSATDGTPAAMWEAIVKTYESKGKTEEDALLQARLARILRNEDYDIEARKVRMWTPPIADALFEMPAPRGSLLGAA